MSCKCIYTTYSLRENELMNGSHSSNQDIISQAHVEISDRKLFDLDNNRAVARNGPMDPRLGISNKSDTCETCGGDLQECNGHFGYVRLVLPAFHVGYFKRTIEILQDICKVCWNILTCIFPFLKGYANSVCNCVDRIAPRFCFQKTREGHI